MHSCVYATVLLTVLGMGIVTGAIAATKAGTVIKNQASASYKDTHGVKRVATSNVVETVIRQVAAIELTSGHTKSTAAGQQLYFAHTVVNTGNGPDTFTLSASSSGGDFSFSNIAVYKDDNRDGEPDSFTPISATILLGQGESQSIVVGAISPSSALNNEQGNITLVAQSEFNAAISASNLDSGAITDSAAIAINKRISALQGASASGPYTVSIYYRNISNVDATDVTLIDALPQGMTYVAGSGRWSESGVTVLTDSDPNDAQGGISYCAYSGNCIGLPEANTDADSLSTNQVTAVIATVAGGANGYIEFEVSVDADLPLSQVFNTAELLYTAGGNVIGLVNSNTVPFRILRGAAVVVNGDSTSSADGTGEPLEISDTVAGINSNFPECLQNNSDLDGDGYGTENSVQCIMPNTQAGNSVFYKNTVWNIGNGIDIFDITTAGSTFPANSLFRFLEADGQTPLLDNSDNGIVDTGPIAPGGSYEFVLQVILPVGLTGDNSGANFEVNTVATSIEDPVATNSMLNRLLNISGGSIDITNIAALGDPAATGAGTGPEASPVSSVNIAPGATAVIDLYINNTSETPMDFDLSASIHSDFSSIELPVGWQLEFSLPDNTVVSNSGVIPSGGSILVLAKITVPENLVPSATSLYFKAQNDAYMVSDIKHDEVVVGEEISVNLGINQNGQTQPGGTHIYTHSLENNGNVDVNNISLSVTDSRASEGWNSLVYEDTDSDGLFSPSDQLVTTTQLIAGERKTVFVKVFAPGTAGEGQVNFSELVAAWGSNMLTVTDITTISFGEVAVVKEQAPDVGCDGVPDSAYSTQTFAVEPGNNCVSYRLSAFNASAQPVLNVLVADATPNFTSYMGNASCSQAACTMVEPSLGSQGEIKASLALLPSGESIVVEFSVRVD